MGKWDDHSDHRWMPIWIHGVPAPHVDCRQAQARLAWSEPGRHGSLLHRFDPGWCRSPLLLDVTVLDVQGIILHNTYIATHNGVEDVDQGNHRPNAANG